MASSTSTMSQAVTGGAGAKARSVRPLRSLLP